MSTTRRLFEAVRKAQKYIKENQDQVSATLKSMLADSAYLRTQLALECFQVVHNSNYNAQDNQVQLQAKQIWSGPNQTKFTAEDVFGHLAHVV